MDKKYQIFVSSTYEDLKEQRDQAVKTILRMGHLPVGMEMFNAADDDQWEIIKRHIDNSDYYVLILAHRYGSEAADGVSYTEKEYNYALEKGVPCLGFVLDSTVHWHPDYMAKGKQIVKLDAFKARVKTKMVNFWKSTDNLALLLSYSLSEIFNTKPRIGWIRANESTSSPLIAEELSRLSRKNDELLAQQAAQNKTLDTSAELIKILQSITYSIPLIGGAKEVSLMDTFLAVCARQDDPDATEVYKQLTDFEHPDERDTFIVTPPLEELTLLGVVDRRKDSTYNQYFLSGKGKDVYLTYRYRNIPGAMNSNT
jgi:hypothetical protein